MTKGVIVGKFFPPHKGHHYLINTGLENCDELTVIVCAKNDQFISGRQRAAWLKEVHPRARVLIVDDNIPENQSPEDYSKAWADYTIKLIGYVPDVAFTSEEYGQRWARYIGCRHHLVDMKRHTVPCSGTMVRSDPLKYLDFLEPPVRAYFVKRICVIGAESTGTTTMAKALAEHYKTNWAPEYGRYYSEGKLYNPSASWQSQEFIRIAEKQNENEDMLAGTANKLLVCDTDSFATGVWHERYLGFRSEEVEKLSAGRKYDLYLVTDTDIPFVQDGTRDGENIREWMHKTFINRLREKNKKFEIMSGSHKARLKKAVSLIDPLLV